MNAARGQAGQQSIRRRRAESSLDEDQESDLQSEGREEGLVQASWLVRPNQSLLADHTLHRQITDPSNHRSLNTCPHWCHRVRTSKTQSRSCQSRPWCHCEGGLPTLGMCQEGCGHPSSSTSIRSQGRRSGRSGTDALAAVLALEIRPTDQPNSTTLQSSGDASLFDCRNQFASKC